MNSINLHLELYFHDEKTIGAFLSDNTGGSGITVELDIEDCHKMGKEISRYIQDYVNELIVENETDKPES